MRLSAVVLVAVSLVVQVAGQSTFSGIYNFFSSSNKQSNDEATQATCGYGSCPQTNPGKINVHIIAHTHDDVGWLKTVDQYFYGTKKKINLVGVQHILDSVIPQLLMDKNKRFIYVEISFFSKWWLEQEEPMKQVVRQLVNEGRLEFINGGWCMNDEATVTYQSTIEQMSLGLRFLNESFGECGRPKVGWQIDPFGHTNEQASLFAQFGFDGMYFTRISQEDKADRTLNKSLDIVWHGDRALAGQSGSIFTNIFRDGYDAPDGYCFDVQCLDDYLVDNKKSYEYNMDSKGKNFISFLRIYAAQKLTNHLLIPMGGDFQFSAAGQNFKALDRLMRYVRENAPEMNIFYSTPSCYQYALYQTTKQKSIKLPEKYDDFMPYDSAKTVWWSGYFSSRPSVKLVEKEISNLLPVARLVSLANLLKQQLRGDRWVAGVKEHESSCLMPLWEILGDLQHHDAITGTERQHVADDYVRRSSDATKVCARFLGELRRSRINDYIKKSPKLEELREAGKRYKLDTVYLEETMFCPLLNISQCSALEAEVSAQEYQLKLHPQQPVPTRSSTSHVSVRSTTMTKTKPAITVPKELQTKGVLVNVYNPLGRPISQHDIRLPCNSACDLDKVRVVHVSSNETMKLIRLPNPAGVTNLPFRLSSTTYELLFYANVPALGYTSFLVEDNNEADIIDEEEDSNESLIITDENVHGKSKTSLRSRRLKREFEYIAMDMSFGGSDDNAKVQDPSRNRRTVDNSSQDASTERVIVKFDMVTGTIVGLKRVSDGSVMNITQKFGYYVPVQGKFPAGAYIFRPDSSEPVLFEKPMAYKMYKRKTGALIEIHQKWTDWIWQTVRVDAKRNYIEYDYVIGPIPRGEAGREVITRYMTSMHNKGVFMTDSNARQLLPRHRLRSDQPDQLGGSFYPVVSTIMLRDLEENKGVPKSSAEAVAILVDRAQAGTSLNEGQMELLVHRRLLQDDHFGVGEPLDEPGEDGRGLVTRGKHRLYVKFRSAQQETESFSAETSRDSAETSRDSADNPNSPANRLYELPETPRANLRFEMQRASDKQHTNGRGRHVAASTSNKTYLIFDHILNELRQESMKLAMKPVLTFDRLRVGANEFMDMISSDGSKVKADLTLLNATLPNNVHILTLQPWPHMQRDNSILMRFENLDNPMTLHPMPDFDSYQNLYNYYHATSESIRLGGSGGDCNWRLQSVVEFDIEYLIKKIKIVSLSELNLGANAPIQETRRLNWTDEVDTNIDDCNQSLNEQTRSSTSIRLGPRQIRTFVASFEYL